MDVGRKALVGLLVLFVAGCEKHVPVVFHDRLIANPSFHDFGLSGEWELVPSPEEARPARQRIVIEPIGEDGSYRVRSEAYEPFDVYARVTPVDDDSPVVVWEVDVNGEGQLQNRYFGFALVEDDQLFLAAFKSKNLVEALRQENVNAVIEHFTFSTQIHCDSEQFLNVLRKHWKNLVGEYSTYRRVKPDGTNDASADSAETTKSESDGDDRRR